MAGRSTRQGIAIMPALVGHGVLNVQEHPYRIGDEKWDTLMICMDIKVPILL